MWEVDGFGEKMRGRYVESRCEGKRWEVKIDEREERKIEDVKVRVAEGLRGRDCVDGKKGGG